MSLNYTTITETFEDGSGNPLSGLVVTFTPSAPVYSSGSMVASPATPIIGSLNGSGQLKASDGSSALQLLATDNDGLTYEGLTGFFFWTVTVASSSSSQSFSFFLPGDPDTVELYALANTSAGGGGGGGGSGSVTSVAVENAHGLAGTVANDTTDAQITLSTTVTGLLKGNGTTISAATSGTDYDAPGAAATAQSNAESFATSAVATETSRAEAAEALALPLAGGTMTGWFAPAVVTLSFGSTIAVNAALGNVFAVTLTASTGTLGAPSNPVDGQSIRIRVIQDGTGSRTLAYNAAYNFGSGSAPTLSTAASAVDVLAFEYEAAATSWRFLGSTTYLNSPLAIASGGTGQTTRQAAINALTGTQSSGEVLRSDGTNAALSAIQASDLPTGTSSVQGALQLDATASHIIADATAAGAGSVGKPADSGHAHPRINWTPSDLGLITWTYDPAIAISSTALATAGTLYTCKMHLPAAASVTNIIVNLATAGNTLTSGQCFAALYQGVAGSLLGTTADQSTSWAGSTGQKTMAIASGPVSAAGGDLIAVLWFNGTTGPTFSRGAFANIVNGVLASAQARFGTANTGVTTTSPGTLGTISPGALAFWVGLS